MAIHSLLPVSGVTRLAAALATGVALAGAVAVQAGERPLVTSQSFDCVIEPQLVMRLASPVEGVIERIEVERGDFVKKGQILARLESGVEQANVSLARLRASNDYAVASSNAKLEFLRRKYDRAGRLKAKEFASAATLEEAEADAKVAEQAAKESKLNVEIARLELERAEVLLEQRILRSPTDGVVVERVLAPGEFRNTQSHILTIAQINPLRVETFLPTNLHDRIKVGALAEIEPEAPYSGPYLGRVGVVDQVLDAASATFGVRLELPNPDYHLPAGLKCKLRFRNEEQASRPKQAS